MTTLEELIETVKKLEQRIEQLEKSVPPPPADNDAVAGERGGTPCAA